MVNNNGNGNPLSSEECLQMVDKLRQEISNKAELYSIYGALEANAVQFVDYYNSRDEKGKNTIDEMLFILSTFVMKDLIKWLKEETE